MRRLFFILTVLLFSCWNATASTEAIGRLFHSPEERRQLDQLRRGDGVTGPASEPREAMQRFTLDGVVRRSDGTSITWINGMPQTGHPPTRNGGAAIRLPTGQDVRLKTGQTYDIESGKVRDLVQP